MQIEENHTPHADNITGYENGNIEINGQAYRQPLFLSPQGIGHIPQSQPQELDAAAFLTACEGQEQPEVILVGTGAQHIFLHPKITAELAAQGIGLESMSTAAACRTYMVLQSEGRRVWAWLWP